MVFFICNYCGDAAKKAAVEKHYQTKCRGKQVNVSCMDCLKDFHGEEFVAHTKCISEVEKYSGKNYVAKESANSGAKKQEGWMEIVRSILESTEYHLKPDVRQAFERIQQLDNVPRKKAKFENFAFNCLRLPKRAIGDIWTILEKELNKMKQTSTAINTSDHKSSPNGDQCFSSKSLNERSKDIPVAEKPSMTHDDNSGVSPEASSQNNDTSTSTPKNFDWIETIEQVLRKYPNGIPSEKLQRKVLKKYLKRLGTASLSAKQHKKFEKRYSKNVTKYPTSGCNIMGNLIPNKSAYSRNFESAILDIGHYEHPAEENN